MSEEYKQKILPAIKDRTVVFIDAANLEHSVQDMWVNPKDIADEFKNYAAGDLCWRVDYKKLYNFSGQSASCERYVFTLPTLARNRITVF